MPEQVITGASGGTGNGTTSREIVVNKRVLSALRDAEGTDMFLVIVSLSLVGSRIHVQHWTHTALSLDTLDATGRGPDFNSDWESYNEATKLEAGDLELILPGPALGIWGQLTDTTEPYGVLCSGTSTNAAEVTLFNAIRDFMVSFASLSNTDKQNVTITLNDGNVVVPIECVPDNVSTRRASVNKPSLLVRRLINITPDNVTGINGSPNKPTISFLRSYLTTPRNVTGINGAVNQVELLVQRVLTIQPDNVSGELGTVNRIEVERIAKPKDVTPRNVTGALGAVNKPTAEVGSFVIPTFFTFGSLTVSAPDGLAEKIILQVQPEAHELSDTSDLSGQASKPLLMAAPVVTRSVDDIFGGGFNVRLETIDNQLEINLGDHARLFRRTADDVEILFTGSVTSLRVGVVTDIGVSAVSDEFQTVVPSEKYRIDRETFPTAREGLENVIRLVIGRAVKVPLPLVGVDNYHGYYDYLVGHGPMTCVKTIYSDIAGLQVIYSGDMRHGQIRRNWQFFNGTQSAPYPGFAFLRAPQEYSRVFADVVGLTGEIRSIGGFVKEVITNTTWGLGLKLTVNGINRPESYFGNKKFILDGLLNSRSAIQLLRDLQKYARFYIEDKGESGYQVEILGTGDSRATIVSNDLGDHRIGVQKQQPPSEIVLRWRFDWENNDYQVSKKSAKISGGQAAQEIDCPFLYDSLAAERLLAHIRRREITLSRGALTLVVARNNARKLDIGDVLTLNVPKILGALGNLTTWRVMQSRRQAGINVALTCEPYTATDYSSNTPQGDSGTIIITARTDSGADVLEIPWSTSHTPPVLRPTPSRILFEQNQQVAEFTIASVILGSQAISFSATRLPAGISLSAAGRISGTAAAISTGTATISISAGGSVRASFDCEWEVRANLDNVEAPEQILPPLLDIRSRSVVMDWHNPILGNNDTIGFQVRFKEMDSNDPFALSSANLLPPDTEYRLQGLDPSTVYEAQIRARNTKDWGDWSEVFVFRTLPSPVPDFGIARMTPRRLQFGSAIDAIVHPTPGADSVTLEADDIPEGLAYNAGTRTISGTMTAWQTAIVPRQIIPDFSEAFPDPVGDLRLSTSRVVQGGTERIEITARWIPPSYNYKHADVYYRESNSDRIFAGTGHSSLHFLAPKAGVAYLVQVVSVGESGLFGLPHTRIITSTIDTTPPGKPATPTLVGALRTLTAEVSTTGAPNDIESYVFRFFKKGEESKARDVRVAAPITGGIATATLTLAGAEDTTWLVKCLALDFHSNESPLSNASNEASLGTPTLAGDGDGTQDVTIAHTVSNARKSGILPAGRPATPGRQGGYTYVLGDMRSISGGEIRYSNANGPVLDNSITTNNGDRLRQVRIDHLLNNRTDGRMSLQFGPSGTNRQGDDIETALEDSAHLITIAAGNISLELPGPNNVAWDHTRDSSEGYTSRASAGTTLANNIVTFVTAYRALDQASRNATTITFHAGAPTPGTPATQGSLTLSFSEKKTQLVALPEGANAISIMKNITKDPVWAVRKEAQIGGVWETLPDSGYSAAESGGSASVRLVTTNQNVATLELELAISVGFLTPLGGGSVPVRATASATFSDTLTLMYGI